MTQHEMIPLSEPVFKGREWEYVRHCLDTGWVSSGGSFVDRFEREVAEYAGAEHCVAVMTGTAAIHLALIVAGVERDDEVLVPALTFVAPANAIRYCGAHPIFVDVDPGTWQMDVGKVADFLRKECARSGEGCVNRATGRRVRAVLPVHILGLACAIDELADLAREYGLRVIEDATEGLGVQYRGRQVGTFGDVGTFSFNGNKVITTGGGGMLVTRDAALAERARYLSTQAKDDALEYVHGAIGYNYRMTNLLAAVGVAQLEQIGAFIERRAAIASRYDAAIALLPGLVPSPRMSLIRSNHWLYTCLLPAGVTRRQRQDVIKSMHARAVGVRPLWHTLHDLAPFASAQAYRVEHAVDLYDRAISLPSGAGLTTEQVDRTIEALQTAVHAI